MSDVIAVSRERIVGEVSAFVQTPFGGQCVRVGVAALASAIAAFLICAVLPYPASSSAPASGPQADRASTATNGAADQTGGGIDVASVWAEEYALLYAASNPAIRGAAANAWSPAGGVSILLATRFPSAAHVKTETVAVIPMPLPAPVARLDGGGRQIAGRKTPAPSGPQLASLPPQTPEPGYFDFFHKLFRDPDEAAQAMLAVNPKTAIYDITRRVVYLPNGDKLEAHSGFGKFMDDPTTVARKNLGVTPPNVYAITVREKPFHGVRALRMTPVGNGEMYGRNGILAHSYLLGEAGASNGCVSIKEYDKFLRAYDSGAFKRIIVLRSLDEPAPALIASAEPGNV